VGRYRNKGIEGLKEGRRSGRPRLIDKKQQEQFKSLFLNAQANRMGGHLAGKEANEIVQEQFSVSYSQSGIYVLLHKCGLSWITGRSRHTAHDAQAQTEYKKFCSIGERRYF
jgi:transposase